MYSSEQVDVHPCNRHASSGVFVVGQYDIKRARLVLASKIEVGPVLCAFPAREADPCHRRRFLASRSSRASAEGILQFVSEAGSSNLCHSAQNEMGACGCRQRRGREFCESDQEYEVWMIDFVTSQLSLKVGILASFLSSPKLLSEQFYIW